MNDAANVTPEPDNFIKCGSNPSYNSDTINYCLQHSRLAIQPLVQNFKPRLMQHHTTHEEMACIDGSLDRFGNNIHHSNINFAYAYSEAIIFFSIG